jgi:hypothetical protein
MTSRGVVALFLLALSHAAGNIAPEGNPFATLEAAAAKSNPMAPKEMWATQGAKPTPQYKAPRLWMCMGEAGRVCDQAESYTACVGKLSQPCVKMFGEMALFCNKDFAQYCPGEQLGLPATKCIREHWKDLTSTCSKMLNRESGKGKDLWRCYIDVQNACGDKASTLFVGGNATSVVEALDCIRHNRPKLMPQCDLLPAVSALCAPDVKHLCAAEAGTAESSLCLVRKLQVQEDHLQLKPKQRHVSSDCRNSFAAINDLHARANRASTSTAGPTAHVTPSVPAAAWLQLIVHSTGHFDQHLKEFRNKLARFLGVPPNKLALAVVPHMHAVNASFVPKGSNVKLHLIRPIELDSSHLNDDKTIPLLEQTLARYLDSSHSAVSVHLLPQTVVVSLVITAASAQSASVRLQKAFSDLRFFGASNILAAISVGAPSHSATAAAFKQANHLVHLAKHMGLNFTANSSSHTQTTHARVTKYDARHPSNADAHSVLLTMRGEIHSFGPTQRAAVTQDLAAFLGINADVLTLQPLSGDAIVKISVLGVGGKVQKEEIHAVELGPSKTATLDALRSALAQFLGTSVLHVRLTVLAGSFTVQVLLPAAHVATMASKIITKATYPGAAWVLGKYTVESAMRGGSLGQSDVLHSIVQHWRNPTPVNHAPHVVETPQSKAQFNVAQTTNSAVGSGLGFATEPPAEVEDEHDKAGYEWSGDAKPSTLSPQSEDNYTCTTRQHGVRMTICGTSVAGAEFHVACNIAELTVAKRTQIIAELAALLHIPPTHIFMTVRSGSVVLTIIFTGEGTHGIELVKELTLLFSSEEDSPRLGGFRVVYFLTPLSAKSIDNVISLGSQHSANLDLSQASSTVTLHPTAATPSSPIAVQPSTVGRQPTPITTTAPSLDAETARLVAAQDAVRNVSGEIDEVQTNITVVNESIRSLEGERIVDKSVEMESNKMVHEDDAVQIEDDKFKSMFDELDKKKRDCRSAFSKCKGFKCQSTLMACLDHARSVEYKGFQTIIREEVLLIERITANIINLPDERGTSSSSSSAALLSWRQKLMIERFKLIDQRKDCEAPYEQCIRTQLSSTPCDASKSLEKAVLCMKKAHHTFKVDLHPLLPSIITAGKQLALQMSARLFDNKRNQTSLQIDLTRLKHLLLELQRRLKSLQQEEVAAQAEVYNNNETAAPTTVPTSTPVQTQTPNEPAVPAVPAAVPAAPVPIIDAANETVVVLTLNGSARHFKQAQIGLVYTELSELLHISPDRIDVKLMTNTGNQVKVMISILHDGSGAILKAVENAARRHKLDLLPYHFPFVSMQVLRKPPAVKRSFEAGSAVSEWPADESVAILRFEGTRVIHLDAEQKLLHGEIAQFLMIAPPQLSTHAVADSHMVAAPRLKVVVSILHDTAGALIKKLVEAIKDGSFVPQGLKLTNVKLLHKPVAALEAAPPARADTKPLTQPISRGLYNTYQSQESASVAKKRLECEAEYKKCLASPFCHKAFGEQQRHFCLLSTMHKFVVDEEKSLAWLDSLMKKQIQQIDAEITEASSSSSASAPASHIVLAKRLNELRSAMTDDLQNAQAAKSLCQHALESCKASSACNLVTANSAMEVCLQKNEDAFVKSIISKFDLMMAALNGKVAPHSSSSSSSSLSTSSSSSLSTKSSLHHTLEHHLRRTFRQMPASAAPASPRASAAATEMKCHKAYTSCLQSDFCDVAYAKQHLAICLSTVLKTAMIATAGCATTAAQVVPCMMPQPQPCTIPSSASSGCPAAVPGTPVPTAAPSLFPSLTPTAPPTPTPTVTPTVVPSHHTSTVLPTPETAVSASLSFVPTFSPTALPTAVPTVSPTTALPTNEPTVMPTAVPTASPSAETALPSWIPTAIPTNLPSGDPTAMPTTQPTPTPTVAPTLPPSSVPSFAPSAPTLQPSYVPSFERSTTTEVPSFVPSFVPSRKPQDSGGESTTQAPSCKEFDDAHLDLGKCSTFIAQMTDGVAGKCDPACHSVLTDFVSSCRYQREQSSEKSSVKNWLNSCLLSL